MGDTRTLNSKRRAGNPRRPQALRRGKPRAYREWATLRRWGKLPAWEADVAGYLLRATREGAGLTQSQLAAVLGISQQAVAQAERWEANPTFAFARAWARACGKDFKPAFQSSAQ